MKIKTIVTALFLSLMAAGCDACGNSSVNNELVGQPKKMHNVTPIFCDRHVDLDMSLGFMKDGVGSVSTQDMTLTVPYQKDVDALKRAIDGNKLVKIHYDVARFTWCWDNQIVTNVEVL